MKIKNKKVPNTHQGVEHAVPPDFAFSKQSERHLKADNGGNRHGLTTDCSPMPLRDDFCCHRRETSTNRSLSVPESAAYYFSSARFL